MSAPMYCVRCGDQLWKLTGGVMPIGTAAQALDGALGWGPTCAGCLTASEREELEDWRGWAEEQIFWEEAEEETARYPGSAMPRRWEGSE